MLTSQEINRYQRQMILPEFGQQGQERLKASRVLVVGAGGLGSPVALYLAAAGVGHLGLIDADVVDISNLHRQILYTTDDVGQPKAECARAHLLRQNPHIRIRSYPQRLDAENAMEVLRDYDLIVDGSDNFATRYLVNDACVLLDKPLVYGCIYQFEGQASLFHYADGPCYRCLFPEPPPAHLAPSCAEAGVLGVLPALIASIQATEAVKVLTGIGRTLSGRLLHYSATEMSFYEMQLQRNAGCPVCGEQPVITELQDYEQVCANAGAQGTQEPDQVSEVTPRQLHSWLQERDVTLIDVRESFEREICLIAGSLHIPLVQLPERIEGLRNRGTLVMYCKSGGRSASAQRQFQDAGVVDAYSLRGGILAWAEQIDQNMLKY